MLRLIILGIIIAKFCIEIVYSELLEKSTCLKWTIGKDSRVATSFNNIKYPVYNVKDSHCS